MEFLQPKYRFGHPDFFYFQYSKNNFLDGSIQQLFYLILKTEAPLILLPGKLIDRPRALEHESHCWRCRIHSSLAFPSVCASTRLKGEGGISSSSAWVSKHMLFVYVNAAICPQSGRDWRVSLNRSAGGRSSSTLMDALDKPESLWNAAFGLNERISDDVCEENDEIRSLGGRKGAAKPPAGCKRGQNYGCIENLDPNALAHAVNK